MAGRENLHFDSQKFLSWFCLVWFKPDLSLRLYSSSHFALCGTHTASGMAVIPRRWRYAVTTCSPRASSAAECQRLQPYQNVSKKLSIPYQKKFRLVRRSLMEKKYRPSQDVGKRRPARAGFFLVTSNSSFFLPGAGKCENSKLGLVLRGSL